MPKPLAKKLHTGAEKICLSENSKLTSDN